MVARLLRSADFQRVLAVAPRSRSTHFAVHHLPACPSLAAGRVKQALRQELSTGGSPGCPPTVDECLHAVPAALPADCWLGLVVPKRHARRAVTRSLIKRQMRAAMSTLAPALAPGLWVLRLKAPFERQQFSSAASDRLRLAAHDELALLVQRAAARR